MIVTFEADDDESARKAAERTAEGQCLADPERVATDGSRGRWELGEPVRRDDADRAGPRAAAHRVDHDRELDVGPRVEEAGGIAVAEPDVGRVAEATPGRGRDDPAHAVVAPRGVADADDHDAAGHARWTVRSRKCVAHEMHGS